MTEGTKKSHGWRVLRNAMPTETETAKALILEVEVSTCGGIERTLVWVPKSQLRVTGDGCEVQAWLLEKLEEKIGAEHPEWCPVGIRLAEDPNQMDIDDDARDAGFDLGLEV